MIHPLITETRSDKCLTCGSSRSIEIYDFFGNPIRYTALLDKYHMGQKDVFKSFKYPLYQARCKTCREVFQIEWIGNTRPIPITKSNITCKLFKMNFGSQ